MCLYLIKFIHLLFVLGLLGSVFYCVFLAGSKNISIAHPMMALGIFMTVLTGTLLVPEKHYTFHTPWIRAAYFFIFLFALGIVLARKYASPKALKIVYFFLFLLLILIVRDAVTKSTVLCFISS